MILVQLYELFTSDPPESLGVRGQTAKAVMHGRNGRDALSDRSVDEQLLGSKDTLAPKRPHAPAAPAAFFATLSNPDAAEGPLRAARRMICCEEKPGPHHGHRGLAAEPWPWKVGGCVPRE
jgi:hypothetical protein